MDEKAKSKWASTYVLGSAAKKMLRVLNRYPAWLCKREYEDRKFTRFNERPIEFGFAFRHFSSGATHFGFFLRARSPNNASVFYAPATVSLTGHFTEAGSSVPEPGSFALLALGLAGVFVSARRTRSGI